MMNEKMNWRKVLGILFILLFITFIVYAIFFLRFIEKSKLIDFEETEEIIYNLTEITTIDKAVHFQEAEGYHIVFGQDSSDIDWLVFVPLQDTVTENDLIIIESESIQTQEQIESNWAEECNDCTLTGSSPAMINNQALWELTYKDESNRYVIEYISLKDGSIYEQMRLIRKYN